MSDTWGDVAPTMTDSWTDLAHCTTSPATSSDEAPEEDARRGVNDVGPRLKRLRYWKKQPPRLVDAPCARVGLTGGGYRQLLTLGVPIAFLNILLWCELVMGPSPNDLDCIEYFCGVGTVHSSFREHNYNAVGYDRNHGALQDINTPAGFLTALQWARRLKPGTGFSHWAPVCSSWIWISRGSSGRTATGDLHGNCENSSVRAGNKMVYRVALIIMYLVAKQTMWIIEQPSSSVMFDMACLKKLRPWFTTHTWMGMFGAATPKPTKLVSGPPWVKHLHRRWNKSIGSLGAQGQSSDRVP